MYDFPMLLRFRCKNFRSIREEQELSLVAINTRSDERNDSLLETPVKGLKALRSAALYGANASGKSNLLSAMHVFSRMVSASQRRWNPTGAIPTWDPFALDESSATEESEFQIDFVIEQKVYNYGFRFNRTIFIEEWLKDITRREKQIFRRSTSPKTIPGNFEQEMGRLATLQSAQVSAEESEVSVKYPGRNLGDTAKSSKHLAAIKLQTRSNSLFLSAAAQNNHEFLAGVFRWIVQRFSELSTDAPRTLRFYTAEYCSEPARKEKVKELLRFADIGIADVEVAEEEEPEQAKQFHAAFVRALKEVDPETASNLSEAPSFSRHNIKMVHSVAAGKSYPLNFEQESAGTQSYFSMLGPLLDVLRDGTLVLIDELEASLHPLLARHIVRIFNDPKLNPNGAQLIFATHDINLLDLDLMRRDQIWFTEKNDSGATILVPLSEFKVRTDQNIASAYMHGRFGGIPFLDERWLRAALEAPKDKPCEPISDGQAR